MRKRLRFTIPLHGLILITAQIIDSSPRSARMSLKRSCRLPFAAAFSVVTILALLLLPSSASASMTRPAGHSATPQCPLSTWSALSPSRCGSLGPVTAVRHAAIPSSGYGYGCGGYYTGTDHPWMTCKGSAIDTTNTPVVVRHGYYNPAADPEGFGWEKARNKHNLWIQAIIDTINMSLDITGGRSGADYTVYHYNPDGYVDHTVTVVADNVDTEFDGKSTQDGQPVGVLTGYCTPGMGDPIEEQCPQWVDTGPDPLKR
jgi:hypothetical protein